MKQQLKLFFFLQIYWCRQQQRSVGSNSDTISSDAADPTRYCNALKLFLLEQSTYIMYQQKTVSKNTHTVSSFQALKCAVIVLENLLKCMLEARCTCKCKVFMQKRTGTLTGALKIILNATAGKGCGILSDLPPFSGD